MAYIEPNSDIYLLKNVPLDPNYENTYYFPDRITQFEFFTENNGFEPRLFSKISYVRKNRRSIKLEITMPYIGYYNYMIFMNTSFERKYFYAFIDDMNYINNNTVEIVYHIDVIQTYLFDIDFNDCWIERQHTRTDNLGEYILDEGLETGDYIVQDIDYVPSLPTVILASTVHWDAATQKFVPAGGELIPGYDQVTSNYYSGVEFTVLGDDPSVINTVIERYTEKNKINSIVAIFMADFRAFTAPYPDHAIREISSSIYCKNSDDVVGLWLDDYHPHNMKAACYPYNFLQLSNEQGQAVDLRYEYFDDSANITLKWFANKSIMSGVFMFPLNYKGLEENKEESVSNNCFPMCCYANDAYKAWIAENKGTIAATLLSVGAGMASSVAPALSFNVGGAKGNASSTALSTYISGNASNPSGAKAIDFDGGKVNTPLLAGSLATGLTLLGRAYDHYTLPPTPRGNGNGDLSYQAGMSGFKIYHKCIRREFAERIDKFFDMYGYKINTVGKPDLNARRCYTYVKTAGCSLKPKEYTGPGIYFEIPVPSTLEIESIFDKGIRFWSTSAVFGSYDWSENNNAPVTNG